MRTLHLVAVEADNEKLAIENAKEAIAWGSHGVIWNWYSVGGIWKEHFDGKHALCYTDNPQLFMESIDKMLEWQNEELNKELDVIKKNLEHLLNLLNNRNLELPYFQEDQEIGRAMYEAGALLNDVYAYNSYLYDPVSESTQGEEIRERCHDLHPERQWLVVFDLHI